MCRNSKGRREAGIKKLKRGMRVTVRNTTVCGKPIVEGIARLVKFLKKYEVDGTEKWMVKFDDEEGGYPRIVVEEDIVEEVGRTGR